MTNTYLFETIKVLSPQKRQEMAFFLASPYFNRGKYAQEIIHLYQIVLSTAPDFAENSLQKEQVYALIFPNSTLESGKLERLIAELNKLLRTFALTDQYFQENNDEAQILDWIRWLRIHGLSDPARKAFAKLKNGKTNEAEESLELYRSLLYFAEEEIELVSLQDQYKYGNDIKRVIRQLDLYYHNYRSEFVNRYILQQKGSELPDLDILNVGSEFYQKESPLLSISNNIFEVLKKDFPTVEDFQEMFEAIKKYEGTLSFQSRSKIYAFVRNACTLLINKGDLEFSTILHTIHQDNLEKGYLYFREEILPNVYLNLVQVAIRANALSWAKDFTETFKHQIIGGDPDRFFYLFNASLCLLAEKKFEDALDHVPEVASNSHYHHMVRRLELKILYELQSDLLLYKIDAFRKFIVRTATKTISANLRTMDLNFLNILMQISQAPLKDKARAALILKRIDQKALLADRPWLIEKAKELG